MSSNGRLVIRVSSGDSIQVGNSLIKFDKICGQLKTVIEAPKDVLVKLVAKSKNVGDNKKA